MNNNDLANQIADFNFKYHLPSDFVANDPDIDHSITLSPAYSAGPPAVIPTELKLQSCCGEITIPLNEQKTSKFKCYTKDELIANPTLTAAFSKYLVDIYSLAPTVLGGYTISEDYGNDGTIDVFGTFDQMIYHMLTDEYVIAGADEACIHYTCEQLWKCWVSSVDVLEDMMALETQPDNTMYQSSTNDDTDEGTSGSTHDETFDNNTGGFGGWLMQWFAEKALSQRMRDALPTLPFYDLNLAENFLECAGYKLRMIVRNNQGADLNSGLLDDDKVIGNNNLYLYTPLIIPLSNPPFHYDPKYAFKYFDYIEGNSLNCEKIFCYTGPTTTGLAGRSLCESDPCFNVNYNDWDSLQVLDFYTCIKTETSTTLAPPQITPVYTCEDLEVYRPEVVDDIQEQRNALISECNQTCDNKKTQYVTALYDLFEANCYVINPLCPESAAENIVTTGDINILADTMVNRCKAYCPSGEIDYCENLSGCVKFNYINHVYDEYGSGFLNDFIIRKLTDCEKLKKQMVDFWDFELSIPSQCDHAPDQPDWILNTNISECNVDGVPQDIEVSNTKTNEIKIP